MTNPLVSVLVPIYNVDPYIEQCARSLFEQTYDNLEFIFCDDCSPDASIQKLKEVMKEYPQRLEQIRIIYHERNRGSAAARNTLIDNCKGDFLFWVDSDDWVDTNAIERLVIKQKEKDASEGDGLSSGPEVKSGIRIPRKRKKAPRPAASAGSATTASAPESVQNPPQPESPDEPAPADSISAALKKARRR